VNARLFTRKRNLPRRLYHFIDSHWGLDDIRRKRIKISRFGDLNDPFELRGIKLPDEEIGDLLIDIFNATFGLVCLSKDWSNALTWSHYAEKHKGFGFGFDLEAPTTWDVKYVSKPKLLSCGALMEEWRNHSLKSRAESIRTGIHTRIEPPQDLVVRSMPVFQRIMTTKFDDWRYEREVRFLARLEKSEDGIYYKDFDAQVRLKEVILGMRCQTTQQQMEELLKDYADPVTVSTARQAENSFRIIG
jgi:hypothetical protein